MKEFKVGDKVFDIRYGKGVVTAIDDYIGKYSITVTFSPTINRIYTKEGYHSAEDNVPMLSHAAYSLSQERVIEVQTYTKSWIKRVLIKVLDNGNALCWLNATTIEEAKKELNTTSWDIWREVQEEQIVELTLQDISEGKGVGVPSHLIRIKD